MSKKLDVNTKYWNAAKREAKYDAATLAKAVKKFSPCVQCIAGKLNGLVADMTDLGAYISKVTEVNADGAAVKREDSEAFKALPYADQQLLRKQVRLMNELVDVLHRRISSAMKREEDSAAAAKKCAVKCDKPACACEKKAAKKTSK